jgi:phospholipid-transporting ATPase
VPQCIEHLAQAGISLWVLTGDKQDTAINIGMACSLLRVGMVHHVVSLEELVSQAGGKMNDTGLRERAAVSVKRQLSDTLAAVQAEASAASGIESSLVIDGFGLTFALSPELSDLFWDLASRCTAVICCRVSPLQKALVTGLVKSKGRVTLAIGDGANDVGMIQAAHIGVGISGQEGMQAVMASDFSIAQFRFLEGLVLIHGRYNYKRIARLVTYFFYKNCYFGFTLFWFNAWSFFSGQNVYNDYMISCYNIFFTFFATMVVAIFDQDISAPVSHHFPQLYSVGQRNDEFCWRRILAWLLNGFYQSVATFLAVFWGQYNSAQPDRASGQLMDAFGAGSAMYTIVVVTVTLQLAMTINHWTWLHALVFPLSIALKYAFILVMGVLPGSFSTTAWGLFQTIIGPTPAYWLLLGVVPVINLLPDFTVRAMSRLLSPDDISVIQEAASLYGHHPPPRRVHVKGGAVASPAAPLAPSGAVNRASYSHEGPQDGTGEPEGAQWQVESWGRLEDQAHKALGSASASHLLASTALGGVERSTAALELASRQLDGKTPVADYL